MELSTINTTMVDNITRWRCSILDYAVKMLMNPFQDAVQDITAMHEAECIRSIREVSVLPNSCAVFDAIIAGHIVHYSVWLALGGIRIGFRIPAAIVKDEAHHLALSRLFDGKDCHRYEQVGDQAIYDWVLTDGLASSDRIMQAMTGVLGATALAIFIGDYLTHIFMASSSIIRNFSNVRRAEPVGDTRVQCKICFSGNVAFFHTFIKDRGGETLTGFSTYTDADEVEKCNVIALVDQVKADLFMDNPYQNQDGNQFIIHLLEWLIKK